MNPEFDELSKPLFARLADKLQSFGLSPKRTLEHLTMFTVLTVIYYCYFVRDAKANTCPDIEITLTQLGVLMLKFLVFSGWPFAVMAAYDSGWRSKDAGNVFLVSYIVTSILWYHKTGCAFCIFAASFRIIPYVFCAWMAHSLGSIRHHWQHDE
jgi:hypothetical protein